MAHAMFHFNPQCANLMDSARSEADDSLDLQYSRHFSFVECNDVTTRSSRSFDKFILQN